ncbi:hypothetical protein [Vibrio diabolicus]|uniref:hypothetical protein n=1 Tax=Vibrio diabolicus TaxID=50719 RepID=UPI0018672653|nr:hypothetical protein [Vibrio diabolicus]
MASVLRYSPLNWALYLSEDVLENFYKNYAEIFTAIELCLEKNMMMPSLSLIYTTIDTLAWIAFGDLAVGKRYKKWINTYMCHDGSLDANADDFYAARCAILHTLTPNSDLSEKKKARVVMYAWGDADVDFLRKQIELVGSKGYVAVHMNDLWSAFKNGVLSFMKEFSNDMEAQKRARLHFSSLSRDEFAALVK